MLYYVKSEILFQDLSIDVEGKKFIDTSELEHKKNDEKKELVFDFVGAKETGKETIITLRVTYSQMVGKLKRMNY